MHSSVAAVAAFLSLALAEQFVMYAAGGATDSVQRIDPVISPGSISGHVHQLFGANNLADDMTYDSLQSTSCTTVGSASGLGNAADHSVYWHPALYAQAVDGSGLIRIPTGGHKLYYQNAGNYKDQKASPFQFPKGFRMIAGNPFMRKAATDTHQQNVTQWICHTPNGMNQGTDGGFPTGVTDCASYPGFNGAIHFPHCWNGQAFDQANPMAHMSYPEGDISAGPCPASHPTRLPHIFLENEFDVHGMKDKIKPDTFVLAQGDSTGYGWHADFFNGWEDGAIPALLASCPAAKYGNQDAGGCSSFKAGSKTSDCKLPVQFVEKVDAPGASLPGCNPISLVNPAPMLPVAPFGSNTCAAGSAPSPSVSAVSALSIPAITIPFTLSTAIASATDPVPSAVLTTIYSLPTAFGGAPTTLATSVRAAPSAVSSSPSGISCPASNGTSYTSNGATFQIECGVDHFAGNLGMKWVTGGLTECIDHCAQTSGCVDVSLSGAACYMKKSLGKAEANAGVNGAKLVSGGGSTQATTSSVAAFGHGAHADYVVVTQYQTVTAEAVATATEYARS